MTPEEVGERVCARFPGAAAEVSHGQCTVTVDRSDWVAAATFARDELGTAYFDFLTGVDETRPEGAEDGEDSYAVVLHLWSPTAHQHVLLRTLTPQSAPTVPTVTGVFAGASWHERETWEMFGVVFDGHPNLTTLLLPDGFQGNPLRKSFVLAARANKAWPGAKEPGESAADLDRGPARRANVPPGLPPADSDWPRGVPVETAHPEGRP